MRYLNFLFLLIFVVSACAPDESGNISPDEIFVKVYDYLGTSEAKDILPLPDGGYVIFGHTDSPELTTNLTTDFFLLFTDRAGNQSGPVKMIHTARTDTTNEIASRIRPTLDGGFLLIGSSGYAIPFEGADVDQKDIYLVKVDGQGNLKEGGAEYVLGLETFNRTEMINNVATVFTEIANEEGVDVVEVDDGYIAVASTSNVGIRPGSDNDLSDMRIFKLSKDLDTKLWDKTVGYPTSDYATGMVLNGTNVAVAGTTGRQADTGGGGTNVWLSSYSISNGGGVNDIVLGDDLNQEVVRLRSNGQDNFFAAGNSTDANGNTRPFMMRVIGFNAVVDARIGDRDGVVLSDISRSLTSDYFLTCTLQANTDNANKGSDMMVMRVNAAGELVEGFFDVHSDAVFPGRVFGGSGNDEGVTTTQLGNGSLLLLGNLDFNESGNTKVWLTKTNSNGILGN